MQKQKVLVIDAISPFSQQLCRENIFPKAEIVFSTDDNTLNSNLSETDVIVTSTRAVPEEMLAKAPRCRLIQKLGTGVNNICIDAATKKGVYVGNVAGENSLSVAEYAVMLILASYRHINIAHNRLVQQNKWEKSTLRDSCCEVSGKKVGIVGFGNIGKKVAMLLQGFQCDIMYYDIYPLKELDEIKLGVRYSELDDLVSTADIISLHVSLNNLTEHMIDSRRLAMMKDDAVLINTGRGGLIDEAALLNTLKQGKLLAVGLDVHEHEPVLEDDPLKEYERVIFSPHTGAGTRESMMRVIGQAFVNINGVLENGKIENASNIVNWKSIESKGGYNE
jgi:D-3-phosphoglycerate dehydrogenase